MSGATSASLFNANYYLQNNPDVVAAIAKGQFTSALDHFNKFGQFENRSPNVIFNGAQYLINSPDVAAAVGNKQLASAWSHFISFGIAEDRSSGTFSGSFNEAAYLAANPDVAAAVKAGSFINGYQHFLLFGQNEGRSGTPTSTSGQTFTLTTGTDTPSTLVGTPGNDLFIGTVTPGGVGQTLNAGDSLDGKGGQNTLQIVDTSIGGANDLAGVTLANFQTIALQNAGVAGTTDTVDVSIYPAVSKVIALNTVNNNIDTFIGLATGAQVIASGAGTGATSAVVFSEKTATDAVSVGVDAGVKGVTFNASGTATAASISSTGASNGNAASADVFNLTAAGGQGTLKTLAVNAATNLNGTLNTADYIASGAALTVSGLATVVVLSGGAAFKTIDASALSAGGVTLISGANLTSFIGGTGANTLTIGAAPATAATVKFGAGNDKLLGLTAAVSPLLTADGGTGFNTLSTGLVNAGNANKFTNFQDLSLQSTANVVLGTSALDVSLVAGVTALSIDAINASPSVIYSNVTQAQGLTDTLVGDNSLKTNILNFTGLSGTANTYTNTFAGAAQTTVPLAANVKEGIVALTGINNVSIVSGGGANTWSSVTLGTDATANTVAITGAQNLDLTFAGFGNVAAGVLGNTGVTLIDGSAATGKLNINEANVTAATAGIAVKGGIANDTITTAAGASTLTGGGGADTFNIGATLVGLGFSATPTFTTITDAIVGDKIGFVTGGPVDAGFITTAINVGTATTLAAALDIAANAAGSATAKVDFFNFGGNTYVLEHFGVASNLMGGDVVAKLNGAVSLTSAAGYDTTNHVLTIG